ncbi:hypothetical protein B0H34DRAFT_673365 [Crassisporium funariophilum]|nr:hypothetical protein B0H34DRAFT_673365 [Crassisporium funariophilum]
MSQWNPSGSASASDFNTSNDVPLQRIPQPRPLKRYRLKAEGVAILEEHYRQHPTHPKANTQQYLLKRIHTIPGCEGYQLRNLQEFFRRRITPGPRERQRQIRKNGHDSCFPSLTPVFTNLVNGHRDPPAVLVRTWAALLQSTGAAKQDVEAWVFQRSQARQLQFPTPSDTSPEPMMTPISPAPDFAQRYKPPVNPTWNTHHHVVSPHEPVKICELSPVSLQIPFAPLGDVNPLPHQQPKVPPTLEAIISGVMDALYSPTSATSDPVPTSAAEFDAMFHPFQKKLELLMLALESA